MPSVTQQPTIAVRRGGLPIQYIIQTQNFSKLEKIPLFMEAVDNDFFSMSDVNLKFNKRSLMLLLIVKSRV
jgi:hypothetical protein